MELLSPPRELQLDVKGPGTEMLLEGDGSLQGLGPLP